MMPLLVMPIAHAAEQIRYVGRHQISDLRFIPGSVLANLSATISKVIHRECDVPMLGKPKLLLDRGGVQSLTGVLNQKNEHRSCRRDGNTGV
jgi:hypothetical protein